MTVRLIVILSLLTGAWKYPGGGLCGCTPINTPYVDTSLIRRPDFRQNMIKSESSDFIHNTTETRHPDSEKKETETRHPDSEQKETETIHPDSEKKETETRHPDSEQKETETGHPIFRKNKSQVRTLNINQLASALALKGKEAVRSLYVYGANPANTVSYQDQVIKGLEREDLFTIVHDRFMTETAMYADIILPATFSVEHHDIYRCYGYCTLGTASPVVKAPADCKSNWDTFALLAKAMGYEEEYFKRTEKEMLNFILDHPTQAVRNLPQGKQQILKKGGSVSMPYSHHLKIGTPTGKFLIVNEELKEAIPRYLPSYGERERLGISSKGEYPLHLVASPGLYSLNSEFRDRDELNKRRGSQKLLIHTQDAAEREIKDSQMVEAYNDHAKVLFQAHVTDKIARGTVVCEGVYRRDECPGGKAFNALTSERLSDMGEGTTLNDNPVQVKKISP